MSKDKYPSMFSPKMEAIFFIIFHIFFATGAVLNIGEYINNSLHSYARTFVRGHYLFREASELLGTDNVQGHISEHIFAAKLKAIVFIIHRF